ncbi:MAG TPA: hypothetical protein PKW90_05065 [Myxococcota bacterium]|nr:hypothetical protein [Myxococcota bacterium]
MRVEAPQQHQLRLSHVAQIRGGQVAIDRAGPQTRIGRTEGALQPRCAQPVPEAADPRPVPTLDGLSDPARQLLGVLDWQGQAVDVLVERLAMEVSTLMAALLELELAGLAMQQNGWYQRCRQ